MSLTAGYTATTTTAFTVTGSPTPSVTKTSGNAAITWDDANKRLNIGAGLGAGSYPVVLTATNGVTPNATFTFTLTVTAVAVAPAITTVSSLPDGTAGTIYTATLTADGTSPFTWSIVSGALPAGITLSPSGVISGTPTSAGTFNFVVQVSNSVGNQTKALTLCIQTATANEQWTMDTGQWTMKAYVENGVLYVSDLPAGAQWSVYSITGTLIYQGTADANVGASHALPLPGRGIYIVRNGSETVKVVY
jgi:hypothetical protein